jgi:hypothetical protein
VDPKRRQPRDPHPEQQDATREDEHAQDQQDLSGLRPLPPLDVHDSEEGLSINRLLQGFDQMERFPTFVAFLALALALALAGVAACRSDARGTDWILKPLRSAKGKVLMPIPNSHRDNPAFHSIWSLARFEGERAMRVIFLSAKTSVLLAITAVTACQSLPGADGRYANFDGGRSNFRASLPSSGDTAPLNEAQRQPRVIMRVER